MGDFGDDELSAFEKIWSVIAWPYVIIYGLGDSEAFPNKARERVKFIVIGVFLYGITYLLF